MGWASGSLEMRRSGLTGVSPCWKIAFYLLLSKWCGKKCDLQKKISGMVVFHRLGDWEAHRRSCSADWHDGREGAQNRCQRWDAFGIGLSAWTLCFTTATTICEVLCVALNIRGASISHCSEWHEVANFGHVPAFCGSLPDWSLPGRQEAQVYYKIQEQQLVGQVQRSLSVVSLSPLNRHWGAVKIAAV